MLAAGARHLEAVAEHYLDVGGVGCLLLVYGAVMPLRAVVRVEIFSAPDDEEGLLRTTEVLLPPAGLAARPGRRAGGRGRGRPCKWVYIRTADPAVDAAVVQDTVSWV